MKQNNPTKKSYKSMIIILFLSIAVIALGLLSFKFYPQYFVAEKKAERQAFFLNNDQVYFGYLEKMDSQNVVIRDAYFLKSGNLIAPENQDDKRLILVKMTGSAHSPEETMIINRSQLIYFQSIKTDSKINQAIDGYNRN